jgi:hypothetical protein
MNLNFANDVDVTRIPLNVITHYLQNHKDCPFKLGKYEVPSDTEYNRWVSQLERCNLKELSKRVLTSQEGSVQTSGYALLEECYQEEDLTPLVYDHEQAFLAICDLHLNFTADDDLIRTLNNLTPILESDALLKKSLAAKAETTLKEQEELEKITERRIENSDADFTLQLSLCRGVPVVEDEKNTKTYRFAQSVLEMPFAFCRVLEENGKLKFNTSSTSTYSDGVRAIYGLGNSFVYDISTFLKNVVMNWRDRPLLTNNHYDNAKKLMGVFASDRNVCIRIASWLSKILYENVSEARQKKYFMKLPSMYREDGNTDPKMWTRSFKLPTLPDDAATSFKRYTKYLILLQELRGKGDKFSDKIYRLPVGEAAIQNHVENAVNLANASGKQVVIIDADTNALFKMAWAIYRYKIKNVKVNITAVTGKLEVLRDCCTNKLDGCIMFYCKLSTVSAPTQNKNLSDAGLYSQVYDLHYDRFNAMPVGTATVIKSYYFPPFKNIKYVRASEPHNGSVIVWKSGPIVREAIDYEGMWLASQDHIQQCLDFAFAKTMFTFSRDRAMCRTNHRIAMKCESPNVEVAKLVTETEEGGPEELGVLDEEYEQGPPKQSTSSNFTFQSSNSSNSSSQGVTTMSQEAIQATVVATTTTTTMTTQTTTTTAQTSIPPVATVDTTPSQQPKTKKKKVKAQPPPPPIDEDDTANTKVLSE